MADAVRRLDKTFDLKEAAHWMAILAMNQYGIFLASLTPKAKLAESLAEASTYAGRGYPSILLPYKILREENPVKASWEATSDSISAYLAWRLKASSLILLKDVDGIYEPPYPKGKLLPIVSVEQLEKWRGKTCVDEELPKLLSKYKIECLVVNGLHPSQVEKALRGLPVKGTKITV